MIFFSGLGILVAPITVVGFLLPVLLEGWVKKQFGFSTPNWLVMSAAVAVPFAAMWLLDFLLAKKGPTRKAVDRKTGMEVEVPQTHTFMFLPVKWCAFVWLGLAICVAVATKFS